MIIIRLKVSFHFDHCELPAGMVITVPAEKAQELVSRGVAELAEPQHAVVQPEETRARHNKMQRINKRIA